MNIVYDSILRIKFVIFDDTILKRYNNDLCDNKITLIDKILNTSKMFFI